MRLLGFSIRPASGPALVLGPLLVLLLLLGGPARHAVAQAPQPSLTFAVLVRRGEAADFRRPLTLRLVADSLVAAIPDAPVSLVLSDYSGPADPGTLQAIGANAGADVVLLSTVDGTDSELSIDLQAIDSRLGTVLQTAAFADRIDSAYRILFGRFWSDLPAFLSALPARSTTARLRVIPGGEAEVRIAGVGRLVATPAAPAEFTLPAPASYEITVYRPDHYPEVTRLLLEPGSETELRPDSAALPRMILDVGLQSIGFPRLTFSWIPNGRQTALGVGLVSYVGGLNPFFASGLGLPFASVPLMEVLGVLAFPPLGPGLLGGGSVDGASSVALQTSLELGLRLNLAGGPLADRVIPLALRIPLDLELLVRRGRAFWFRVNPTLYYLADPVAGAVLLSSGQIVGPRPIPVGRVGVQALDISVGFRMAF